MRRLVVCTMLFFAIVCWHAGAHAVVYWTEDFENHLWTGSNGNPWDTSACTGSPQDGCNGSISTDVAHSGTHSFKGDYTCPGSEDGLTQCGTFYDRGHTPTTEVYTRVYYYTIGFTYSPVETKHWFHKANNTTSDVIADNWNSERNIGLSTEQQIADTGAPCKPGDTACIYAENVGSVPLNDGQWYCIETHFKSNTAGNSDGVVEVWVDGVRTVNYTGRSIFATPPNFEIFRIYVQHGHGLMYYDDLAVGNTRIGCLDGGGGGSTAGGGLDF